MTHEFANLQDAGRQLGALLVPQWRAEPASVLLPVLPNGVPVARGISGALATAGVTTVECQGLSVKRSTDGVDVDGRPDLAGRTVVVVDDGVETGTVARAVATALRSGGVIRLVLAVPVCPREAMADLQQRYDAIVAVSRPLVRRALTWHYAEFDTIDDAEAVRQLGASVAWSPAGVDRA